VGWPVVLHAGRLSLIKNRELPLQKSPLVAWLREGVNGVCMLASRAALTGKQPSSFGHYYKAYEYPSHF
jgi:hypothetical protein